MAQTVPLLPDVQCSSRGRVLFERAARPNATPHASMPQSCRHIAPRIIALLQRGLLSGVSMKFRTAITLACALAIITCVASANEPIVHCNDIREIKLQIERNALDRSFRLLPAARRFAEDTFGIDAGAFLTNINAIADYLNSQSATFRNIDKFFVLGDLVESNGPIFLLTTLCAPFCKSFELHRSSNGFTAHEREIGPKFLRITYRTEEESNFKIILASTTRLGSLEFIQKMHVAQTWRLRTYQAFGRASDFTGARCLQPE